MEPAAVKYRPSLLVFEWLRMHPTNNGRPESVPENSNSSCPLHKVSVVSKTAIHSPRCNRVVGVRTCSTQNMQRVARSITISHLCASFQIIISILLSHYLCNVAVCIHDFHSATTEPSASQ